MTILAVKQLTILRNAVPVIEDLSFTLGAQERVFLQGEIGAGKSTLLHCLLGFVPPQQGEIRLFGQVCRGEADFVPLRGSQVGLLFQQPDEQLFGPTVLEDVAFGPQNQGFTPKQAQQIAYQQLCELGIAHLSERSVNQLSGGEKNFSALAGVLAMKPKLLLLDEPTNGLDRKNIDKLVQILSQINLPMLIASHDQPFTDRLAQRVIYLAKPVSP